MKNLNNNLSESKANQWILSQEQLAHLNAGVVETLLSVGNGTLGTRGTSCYESDVTSSECEGTYINGAYMREAIEYDESAYGFAQFNNKMLQVFNSKSIEILTDNELFIPYKACEKYLDLRQASYHEVLLLKTNSGKEIKLHVTRIACQHQQNMMMNHYVIESMNFSGKLQIKSFIKTNDSANSKSSDPRVGNLSTKDSLLGLDSSSTSEYSFLLHQLQAPKSLVIAATSHEFEQTSQHTISESNNEQLITDEFEVQLTDNMQI